MDSTSRAERRILARIDPDERLVAWTRGWVSRDGRAHSVFAARTLDYIVVTDAQCCLFNTGFFTRCPRRRVFGVPFDRLAVTERKGKLHLRVAADGRRPLLFDLRNGTRSEDVATALLARTKRRDDAE
jgi:hypothetical protein